MTRDDTDRRAFSMIGKVEVIMELIATESMPSPTYVQRLPAIDHLPTRMPVAERLKLVHGMATGVRSGVDTMCEGRTIEHSMVRELAKLVDSGVLTSAQAGGVLLADAQRWHEMREYYDAVDARRTTR